MSTTAASALNSSSTAAKDKETKEYKSLLDFTSLPPEALEAYISYYGLAKGYPPPLSTSPSLHRSSARGSRSVSPSNNDGESSNARGSRPLPRRRGRTPPSDSNGQSHSGSAALGSTTAAAGGADATTQGTRKRTAAAVEMEERALAEEREMRLQAEGREGEPSCPTHFPDAESATSYLGNVAQRHFANQPAPKEGEAVVGFLYRCATKDKVLKIA